MLCTKDQIVEFSKNLDALRMAVNKAVQTAYPEGKVGDLWQYAYIREWYDDHVIVDYLDKIQYIPYTVEKATGDVTLDTQAAYEVKEVMTYPKVEMSTTTTAPVFVPVTETVVADFAVTREAKLFEAGSYPDKGIDITEDDLDNIVASHTATTPLKIEHGDSVFDNVLGTVSRIYRQGKELMGSLSFTDAAWNLLQQTECRGLSCGIRKDKTGLAEVSLVRNPRVADAQVFSADEGIVGFTSDVPWTYNDGATKPKEVITMPEVIETPTVDMSLEKAMAIVRAAQPSSEAADLLFKATNEQTALTNAKMDEVRASAIKIQAMTKSMQKMATESTVIRFKNEGKITPAAEPFARAILEMAPIPTMQPDPAECVTFSDADGNQKLMHFAEAFAEFLRVMPASVNFRELARQAAFEDSQLTSEQRAINAKLGVSDDDFRKYVVGGGA